MPKPHRSPRFLLPLVLAAATTCLQTAAVRAGDTLPQPTTTRTTPARIGTPASGKVFGLFTVDATTTAPFSRIIIFGDSLSDVGNDADLADDKYGIRFPGPDVYNSTGDASTDYTDGRFTDGTDTNPAAITYGGVWHEQLAKLFLNMPVATASNDKGFDFAFGGATTGSGQSTLSEEDGAVSLTVDNMTRQVANYFDANTPDPAALYILWGGANDLFDDAGESGTAYDNTATAASNNEVALIQRLAEGGAKYFLINNLPPLDLTPDYNMGGPDTPLIKEATVNFNTQLAQKIAGLQQTLAGEGLTVIIYQMDVYGLFQRLLANQYTYGFTDITDSSQTAGSVDPDKYLFWDDVHPTTAGHFQLAAEAYTVLTGVPIVETYPKPDNTGFYLTRTGADVSKKLFVNYALGGSNADGSTVASVQATKKIKANKQSTEVDVTPAAGQSVETFKLKPPTTSDYELPVIKKAKIKLDQ